MPLGQQLVDFVLSILHEFRRTSRSHDRVDIVEFRAAQPLANRRDRHQDNIVQVLSDHVRALLFEHADHLKRNVLDPNRLADGVGRLEQLDDQRVTNHADFGRADDITFGEELAPPELPVPHGEIVATDPVHFVRAEIGTAINHLATRAEDW